MTGTAKRHGIQAQQIYRRRERLFGPNEPVGFVPVSVVADPSMALPAPVPEECCRDEAPVPVLDVAADDRIEIVAAGGVAVRLPPGSAVLLIVAIAAGVARRRR